MSAPASLTVAGVERPLTALACPLAADALIAPRAGGGGPWHVELGFGKGRYLLRQAQMQPEARFLGLEMVGKYARLLARRAARRGVSNLAVIHGEALYLSATTLPRAFADTLHIYFPDPWPKSKHHRRRLFDPTSIDLVLGVLRPGGRLFFATDFLAYGEDVADLLAGTPGIAVLRRLDQPWPGGARTNYEAKYMTQGRPILRLIAELSDPQPAHRLHPAAGLRLLAGSAPA